MKNKLLFSVLLLTLIASSISTHRVNAAPGNIDTSFGKGGVAMTTLSPGTSFSGVQGITLQTDGKILLAGYYYDGTNYRFGLVRFNPDGNVDPTFGNFGLASTPPRAGVSAFGSAVAVQSDGKIVEVGEVYRTTPTNYDFYIARFNYDGSLDTGFGPNSNGTVAVDFFGFSDNARAVMIQSDGSIAVFGQSYNGGVALFSATRLTSNGGVDTSFGSSGKVTTSIGSGDAILTDAIMQSDGKFVAVGYSIVSGQNHFTAARYTTGGVLDSGFGSSGVATIAVTTTADLAYSVAQQPDGKIVSAGLAVSAGALVYGLVRYNTDGSPDTSFGSGGKVTTVLGINDDEAWRVAVQANGKIIVLGATYTGSIFAIGIVRYNSDGSLDSSFGSGGKVIQTLGTNSAYPRVLAIQQDGKILAAWNFGGQVIVMRFQGDPPVDNVAPTWPTGSNITATVLSSSSVFLTWTSATDNVGVTAYRVYQGSTLLATLPSTSSSYLVTGLTQGSSYNFKVQAGDAANNWSTTGPSASATLPAPPSFLAANLPWLILIAVVIGFGVALVLTKPKAPKMG